jgi:uncharacterized membrane protein
VALSQGEAIEATVADHDAEDRATLERYGVYTQPATKDVSPGIQAVQARLRRAGDGKFCVTHWWTRIRRFWAPRSRRAPRKR